MWLIDINSLKLKYFQTIGNDRYAILSHTWEGEEVTFQDLQSPALEPKYELKESDVSKQKERSMTKLRKCCERAKEDGYSYAWVDTCCIDKRSSAELSEAINSMFSWYKRSKVCYVYLSDVEGAEWDTKTKKKEIVSHLRKARWFTRGWTLQELIAPVTLIFFSRDWVQLGVIQHTDRSTYYDSSHHRIDSSDLLPQFEEAICSIANIPRHALGQEHLTIFTVAEKMSWAANRNTTRVEDSAYSLIGIFDINMPLLYGEGHKAFQRLQKQIIETTEDYTIFAWEPMWGIREPAPESGSFLAVGPRNFTPDSDADWTYQDLEYFPNYRRDWDQSELKSLGHIPPSVTSRGIWMPLPVVKSGTGRLALLCRIPKMGATFWLGIKVQVWTRGNSGRDWLGQMLSRSVHKLTVVDVKDITVQLRLIYASTRDEYI